MIDIHNDGCILVADQQAGRIYLYSLGVRRTFCRFARFRGRCVRKRARIVEVTDGDYLVYYWKSQCSTQYILSVVVERRGRMSLRVDEAWTLAQNR